jgi:hypothetical protein
MKSGEMRGPTSSNNQRKYRTTGFRFLSMDLDSSFLPSGSLNVTLGSVTDKKPRVSAFGRRFGSRYARNNFETVYVPDDFPSTAGRLRAAVKNGLPPEKIAASAESCA